MGLGRALVPDLTRAQALAGGEELMGIMDMGVRDRELLLQLVGTEEIEIGKEEVVVVDEEGEEDSHLQMSRVEVNIRIRARKKTSRHNFRLRYRGSLGNYLRPLHLMVC